MRISDNYRVLPDDNNVILQFHENRTRVKKDGSTEVYEYTENTYHKTMKQALTAFLNKSQEGSQTVSDLILRIEKVEAEIEKLNLTK